MDYFNENDVSAYFYDEDQVNKIKLFIDDVSNKYNVKIQDASYFSDFLFREFLGEDVLGDPRSWRKALMLMQLMNLDGDGSIKVYPDTVRIDAGFVEHMKDFLLDDWVKVLKRDSLWGYNKNEIPGVIRKYAEEEEREEKKKFKLVVRNCIAWLNDTEAVNKTKTISDDGGAFLYDLFYFLKHQMKTHVPIKWEDPEIPDKAEKRRVIIKYLRGR